MTGLLNQQQGLLQWLQSPQAQGMAQGLLAASGPSRMPIGMGQAIGMGMQQGKQYQDDERKKQLDELLFGLKLKEFEQLSANGGMTPYQRESLRLQDKRITMGNGSYVDPETGEIIQNDRKLSATEQKELFDAMDLTSSGEGALASLTKAKDILTNSPKGAEPYTGFGAELRAGAARLPVIGDIVADKERGSATTEYRTQVTEQALNNLKAIFGGMPTEGERKVLMDMQALPDFTPQEQERILNNAIAAAERRMKFNQSKIEGIQTGSYRRPTKPNATGGKPNSGGWTIEEVQ